MSKIEILAMKCVFWFMIICLIETTLEWKLLTNVKRVDYPKLSENCYYIKSINGLLCLVK